MGKEKMRYLCVALLPILLAPAVTGCSPQTKSIDQVRAELDSLYRAKNYFSMEEQLTGYEAPNDPAIIYYRALVKKAFNEPEISNRLLASLPALENAPDSLLAESRIMRMENHLRLHQYGDALEDADEVLKSPAIDDARKNDVRNTRLILNALRDVPPQQIFKRGRSILELKGTHIELAIDGHRRDYAYDTGANYSILMESEAESAGLDIIRAGFDVGTSTGATVKGDVAVADSLSIGKMILTNVVFLVFPDEALTFPGGFKLYGIVGFPVLEAMGELRFSDGSITVPATVPDRDHRNMALEGLTPLIRFDFEGDELPGILDTGANKTVFYEPFFRTYFSDEVDSANIDTIRSGGVGGVVSHPVYRIERIEIGIAGRTVRLDSVYAHTGPLSPTSTNELYANIGLDLLDMFDGYILNFRDMAFIPQ